MHAPAWNQDLEAARAGDRGALERVLADYGTSARLERLPR